MIQVVDLAATFSAGQLRGRDGEVLDQFDSRNKTHFQFATEIARNARRDDCELTIIEDVPYQVKHHLKPIFRLQGFIILAAWPVTEKILWAQPAAWMPDFPGVQRAPKGLKGKAADDFRIEAARQHALDRGYEPPDLTQDYLATVPEGKRPLRKFLDPLEKNMTDYVSAFLIGEWGIPLFNKGGADELLLVPGVQPTMI